MDVYKQKNRKEILILISLCLFLEGTLIVSDILTFKITSFLSIIFTIPALLYPLTYAIGDTLTEAYGRKTTLAIFSIAIFIEVFFDLLISYAATVHSIGDQQYFTAFNYSLSKMYIAALGVVIGSILGFSTNTVIMYFLKTKFSYRSFPIRSICSSLIGEIVFTITAFSIWFYSDPNINVNMIARLILSSSSLKVFFAILYSMPAYWIARKLVKSKISPEEALRIIDVTKLSDTPGNSIFNFQIVGKRTGFSSLSKNVSLNMYYALNKADQKLIESDLKGRITHQLDEWVRAKHDNTNCTGCGWDERNWPGSRKNAFA